MISRKVVTGEREMLAQIYLKKGALVPMHSHESEQMTYVLQGALKFLIGGEEITVREGEVLHIPSWVEHQAEALDDTFELDLFSPIRQDWLDRHRHLLPPEIAWTFSRWPGTVSAWSFSCAASRGLGRATALSLAREGAAWRSVRAPRRRCSTRRARDRARDRRVVVPIVADVASAADSERLVARAASELGGIDILVTNTGGPEVGVSSRRLTDEDWYEAIDSVLMSVVRLSRAVSRTCARAAAAASSTSRRSRRSSRSKGSCCRTHCAPGSPGWRGRSPTKLATENILVNCVAPGYTSTDRVIELAEAAAAREGISAEAVQQRTEAQIPMGRMATTEEFGDVVAFLASGKASYVTGTTLQIDGGYVRSLL